MIVIILLLLLHCLRTWRQYSTFTYVHNWNWLANGCHDACRARRDGYWLYFFNIFYWNINIVGDWWQTSAVTKTVTPTTASITITIIIIIITIIITFTTTKFNTTTTIVDDYVEIKFVMLPCTLEFSSDYHVSLTKTPCIYFVTILTDVYHCHNS